MNFIVGFFVAIGALVAASHHLQQGPKDFWDFVAFSVVSGGTISVMLMTRPKLQLKFLAENFVYYLFGGKKDKLKFIKRCFATVTFKTLPDAKVSVIEDKIIVDGLEMIELGFDKEKIEDILSDRYMAYKKSVNMIAHWVKRSAKYPPAFGLGGTVLGLIHLMKGISGGLNPKDTGLLMAVALVATLYGILVSNLVLNPMSEAIAEKLKSDEELVEAAIKTVLMIKEGFNLLECQETLNSYLGDVKGKINFMSSMDTSEEDQIAEAA
ncbi:MAG: MotA/TolQ/ExbB proton channel family protein [Rhizobacter sp.]|nr:MotA/TolQ/ExbB proton channel family protein [Bacteriovorax sp.]